MDALPRSLDPLPEEALGGYLLRVSYRIGITPLHLVHLAGWLAPPRSHIRAHLLLGLAGPDTRALAQLARLTEREVTDLTLAAWRSRYSPIKTALGHTTPRLRKDPWVNLHAARYCPQCLAGDGTKIQTRYGGAWQKVWHLPIAFACLHHRRFLRDRCPACGGAVGPGHDTNQLIARPGQAGLHPLQCRHLQQYSRYGPLRSCGTRLDQEADHDTDPLRPGVRLLQLQQRLITRLHQGDPDETAQYFADLRHLVALLYLCWPRAQDILKPELPEQAAAFLDRQWWSRSHDSPAKRQARRITYLQAPPSPAPACAVFLQAAETLLRAEDLPSMAADLLHSAFERPDQSNWARAYNRQYTAFSGRLHAALDPMIKTQSLPRRGTYRRHVQADEYRSAHTVPALTDSGATAFGPHHIPAYLKDDWVQPHLTSIPGVPTPVVRRAAAARLVQLAADCTLHDAAAFLGIPARLIKLNEGLDIPRWLSPKDNAHAFAASIENLVHHLDQATDQRINYQRRRDALSQWFLSEETWHDLIQQLPRRKSQLSIGDPKRQIASMFVWARVTGGDHWLAPRPLEAGFIGPDATRWATRRTQWWRHLTHPTPIRHYAKLRTMLVAFSEDIAQQIDTTAMHR